MPLQAIVTFCFATEKGLAKKRICIFAEAHEEIPENPAWLFSHAGLSQLKRVAGSEKKRPFSRTAGICFGGQARLSPPPHSTALKKRLAAYPKQRSSACQQAGADPRKRAASRLPLKKARFPFHMAALYREEPRRVAKHRRKLP